MNWTDVRQIAVTLSEKHPGIDPTTILFTDLQQLVIELEGFEDIRQRCNEKVLEGIQAAWIEEL